MDKDVARSVILQVIGFIRIFGFTSERAKAAVALLEIITKPEVWDGAWDAISRLINGNPALLKVLQDIADKKVTPSASLQPLLEILGEHAAQNAPLNKSAEYYKWRQGVAGIIMLAQGYVMFTPSPKDDAYVNFVSRLVWANFDEAWAIEHPNE